MLDAFQVVYVLLLEQFLDFYIVPDFDKEMTWSRAIAQACYQCAPFLSLTPLLLFMVRHKFRIVQDFF